MIQCQSKKVTIQPPLNAALKDTILLANDSTDQLITRFEEPCASHNYLTGQQNRGLHREEAERVRKKNQQTRHCEGRAPGESRGNPLPGKPRQSFAVTLLLLIVLIFFISPDANAAKKHKTKKKTPNTEQAEAAPVAHDSKWNIHVDFDGNIFPSYLIATSNLNPIEEIQKPLHLGDPSGVIGVTIRNPKANSTIEVIFKECASFKASRFVGQMTRAGEEYTITPKINWNYDELLHYSEQKPIEIAAVLVLNNTAQEGIKTSATIHSINDALLSFTPSEDETYSYPWTLATYVDEQHPYVETVIKSALALGVVKEFNGLKGNSAESVYLQAFAVWKEIESKGSKYNLGLPKNKISDRLVFQHVPTMDQISQRTDGTSYDASILLASVFQKIGLPAYIAILPDQMFVAFDLDEQGSRQAALMVTALNLENPAQASAMPELGSQVLEQYKNDKSFKTFLVALSNGAKLFYENRPHLAQGNDQEYLLINISEARKNGVKALGR